MKVGLEGLQEIVYALPLSAIFKCHGYKVNSLSALNVIINICFDY